MSNTVNMTIRIDKNLKKDIDVLFNDLGISTNSAITMFLKQCSREQALPFTPTIKQNKKQLSNELVDALKEAEKIRKDPNRKGYENLEELMKAVLGD